MSALVRTFDHPPHFGPAWFRALLAAGKHPRGELVLPRLDMVLTPQPLDAARLATYRQLCGFAPGPFLPPTWPQVQAGALHLHMLTDPRFPLPAMGIVHLRNHIWQLRPIFVDEPLHYACHLEPARPTPKGDEIDLVTDATVNDVLVWRSVITMLSRARKPAANDAPKAPAVAADVPARPDVLRSVIARVPEDMGRRYAKVAGDYNPIHQYAWMAQGFGFKRAIVHGMWSLGRCVAEAGEFLPRGPLTIDVSFQRPVFLPSTVVVNVTREDPDLGFVVVARDGNVTNLRGQIRAASAEAPA